MQDKVSNPFVPPNCYRPNYIKGECKLKNSEQRVGIVNYQIYEKNIIVICHTTLCSVGTTTSSKCSDLSFEVESFSRVGTFM